MKTRLWTAAAFVAVATIPFFWPLLSGSEDRSRLAPYRYPLATKTDSETDLAFLQERIARNPEGLDLAALAGALLKKARRTGQSRWIDDAEAAARRSLEILPVCNPGATLSLAHAAQMKHDFTGSIALCERVLAERPRDGRALTLLATARLGLGRLDEAIAAADALVDRAPISENLALRAVVLSARGEEREALHDFQKACALEEPGDPEGSAWLRAMWARIPLQHGRWNDAEDLLREALRIRPFHPVALGLLGDLEADRGHADAADQAWASAYQGSSDPVFLCQRAALKNDPELRAAAEKALREAPGHRIQLAQVLLDRGADAEALGLAEAEAKTRRNADTLDTLARALAAAGRLREAQAAIREALRTGIQDARLQRRAADIEARLGCASRAELHRALAAEIHP